MRDGFAFAYWIIFFVFLCAAEQSCHHLGLDQPITLYWSYDGVAHTLSIGGR